MHRAVEEKATRRGPLRAIPPDPQSKSGSKHAMTKAATAINNVTIEAVSIPSSMRRPSLAVKGAGKRRG
jgi:hypothetical protein